MILSKVVAVDATVLSNPAGISNNSINAKKIKKIFNIKCSGSRLNEK